MKGVSHTDEKGTDFALKVMKTLRAHCESGRRRQASASAFTAHLQKAFATALRVLIRHASVQLRM